MRLTVAFGLAAVVFGFTVVVQRGFAAAFGSMSYAFVTLVGTLALVQGLRYANDARNVDARATETADVEDRHEVPSPGTDVDELLAGAGGLSTVSIRRRRELRDRLERVARETLQARGNDDEAVSDALADGSWTRDPVAAWFVGPNRTPPVAVRLRGVLGSDVEFTFAARRTIEALANVHANEGDIGPRPSPEQGGVLPTARAATCRRLRALRDHLRGVGR